MLNNYYVDLHVHIGATEKGRTIKYAAARSLTFRNIAEECARRKGIQIIGVVDCLSPLVQEEITRMRDQGEMSEHHEGGLRYLDKVTVLVGGEIETNERNGGNAHCLTFFPDLMSICQFSNEMVKYIKNIRLSTQRCHLPVAELARIVLDHGGIILPAHVFSPFKSVYGNCTDRLTKILPADLLSRIPAVELGLSADTNLADLLSELGQFTYLSNSDAHSLAKIGREYNVMGLAAPTYQEVLRALRREAGRSVIANYGLDPRLGKYHRTFCPVCEYRAVEAPPVLTCPRCGEKTKIVTGVLDRIVRIADRKVPVHPPYRPPYYHQIPLEFVPGVGKATLDKLIAHFGSEMAVLHDVNQTDLAAVVKPVIAERIILAREGKLQLSAGGGGIYGKVIAEE